jgi:cytochrome b involved in lipid metabolism
MIKIFTWEEIRDKKLIVANNNVYNIMSFLDKHPGGPNALLKSLGNDCTNDYNFHLKKGKSEWKKYKVGELEKNNCCIIL